MGWLWLAMIGATVFIGLWSLGIKRELGWAVGAALLIGAAGYAWQQKAGLPGHPVQSDVEKIEVDRGFVAFRSAIMPGDEAILEAADDKLRAGDATGASQVMIDAIAMQPDNAQLWAGLGGTIAAHDGGQVSPAATFAFRKAVSLAPDAPGPPFLLGLAYLQAGQLPEAQLAWQRTLALTPQDAPYRAAIVERLGLIDQILAMKADRMAPR